MRTRESIEEGVKSSAINFANAGIKLDLDATILEVLLDIRDLLQANSSPL